MRERVGAVSPDEEGPEEASGMSGFSRRRRRAVAVARVLLRRFGERMGSSLTRRILLLNLAGLAALLVGFLYLNQFREGLIDARVQTLLTQGEIIAGAIAAAGTVDSDLTTIDPEKLLQLQLGESSGTADDSLSPLDFAINPERVAPVLRRLVTPTRTRARIYDRDGSLVLDSQSLFSRGDILRLDLPPVPKEEPTLFERARSWCATGSARRRCRWRRSPSPMGGACRRCSARSRARRRAWCASTPPARPSCRSRCRCSAAARCGARCCSRRKAETSTRSSPRSASRCWRCSWSRRRSWRSCRCSAGAIAGPIAKLADAADRVRRRVNSRQEIPDFTDRSDEIGHLSGSLRDMTRALYNRIEAIESFAADVSHELKNPLTSLRSAVETLPLARDEGARRRLLDVIQHDVRRLDRLISDISDASRMDAEMARADFEPIDLTRMLDAIVSFSNEARKPEEAEIRLDLAPPARAKDACLALGHDSASDRS